MVETLEYGCITGGLAVMDAPWSGARLRDIREQAGLKQFEAAELMTSARRRGDATLAGIAQGMLSQWESGKRVPDADDIYIICEALHCTCADLYRSVGVPVRFRGGKPTMPADDTITDDDAK